jgi:ABC-type uncharacterized transport system auxiliary subunit
VAVTGRVHGTRALRLAVPVTASGTPAIVAAMSAALGHLADAIVAMLA